MTYAVLCFGFFGGGFLTLSWVAKDMKNPHARGLFVLGLLAVTVALGISILG